MLLGAAAVVTACGGWIDLEPAGSGGQASAAGSSGDAGTGGSSDAQSDPFKMLVLTTALEYRHDSITDCQRMLSDLGQTPDDQLPVGAKPGSRFTIHVATDDLADFTPTGLKDYGMLFWCPATGDVFSDNPRVESAATAMAALRDYVEGGGAWGGVHSATDFEKTGNFPWYTDTLVGGYLQSFDADGTPGTVQVEPGYVDHPVMRGVPPTWSVRDEWFRMNRDVGEQPGFQIVSRLVSDSRPAVWIKELGAGNRGRMFYTIRGHAPAVYREAEFRQLVLNGILWATRRLEQ
ncbi:MAG: alpha-mannosidase [Polyangiaceae bacterium]|nr:alpha-mannosidase [Polyangiaceae bacterium]